ncbi:MAG: polysulfide reductase NrfD [Deltaproteobacteria bacterium]|nr:polysulfide reductase NrfD [Deltaproteobacteria bacterium]
MTAPAQTKSARLLSPFNAIATLVLVIGGIIFAVRFVKGLAATTNLDNNNPWGLWIGFDVMAGVALAAGGFVTSSGVYLFGMKEYRPVVRPAILTGFLGYFLVVVGLLADLGRPWRLPYPFLISPGWTSPLFEVALCVALYLTTLLLESAPAAFEWLGWKKLRTVVGSMTIALTILGLILSTMHQSTLGAMFMATPTKLHPLWYSPYLPVHFFISAVAVGLSMVIVEGAISHRVFHERVEITRTQFDAITLGLGKAAAVALAVYFSTKVLAIALEDKWHYLGTRYGLWYLFEIAGFVVLPCFLLLVGYRERRVTLVRIAAGITVAGVVLNRLNVAMFAFNWRLPWEARYWPHPMEIAVSLSLVMAGVVMFRWIASRMPILHEHPDWKGTH